MKRFFSVYLTGCWLVTSCRASRTSNATLFADPGSCRAVGDGALHNGYVARCDREPSGHDIVRRDVTRFTDCEPICDAMPGCKAFVFRARSGEQAAHCWFKADWTGDHAQVTVDYGSRLLSPKTPATVGSCGALGGTGTTVDGFRIECGRDRVGTTIGSSEQPSLKDCIAACKSLSGCVASSFVRHPGYYCGRCFQIANGGPSDRESTQTDFVSKVVESCRDLGDNQDYLGYRIQCERELRGNFIMRQNVKSITECAPICDGMPGCLGWTYRGRESDANPAHCWFADRATSTVAQAGVSVGTRSQPRTPSDVGSCRSLGDGMPQTVDGYRYLIACNRNAKRSTIATQMSATFQDCLVGCSDRATCMAVSYVRSPDVLSGTCHFLSVEGADTEDAPGTDFAYKDLSRCQGVGDGNTYNGYTAQCATDSDGSDMLRYDSPRFADCGTLCDQTPGCVGWTWRPAASGWYEAHCWLKASNGTTSRQDGVDFAARSQAKLSPETRSCRSYGDGSIQQGYTIACNRTIEGGGILGEARAATFGDCFALCDATPGCKAFSLLREPGFMHGRCQFLRQGISTTFRNDAVDYAFKAEPVTSAMTTTVMTTTTTESPAPTCTCWHTEYDLF